MAKPTDKERVGQWEKRLAAASAESKEWENEFSCDMLEDFYYGRQHKGEDGEWDQRKYVINLFYPSINISKPSMLFALPKYKVTPRITRIDDPMSDSEARAKLQEETLNTFVGAPQLGFDVETGLAILDAQFRFGIVQVGYTADYVDNPNAGKPILKDGEAMMDGDNEPVVEPKINLTNEGLFYKWISAKNWRVGVGAGNRTSTIDWCGYYDYLHVEDIQRNPRYKNTSNLKGSAKLRAHKDEAADGDERKAGLMKVWFIWDMRARKRYVFGAGLEKFLLEESFSFLPFAALKFDERLGKWHPLPPTYNWVHPQNQLNDIRNKRKVHRERANRRYARGANTDENETNKLQSDEDFLCIVLPNPATDLIPIPDAPMDPAIFRDEDTVLTDFTRVSGISGESQQVAESETATQANLIALAEKTREASKRLVVAKWLSEIGRLVLMTLRENMALPFWIKHSVDPYSPLAQLEAQEVTKLWQQITAEEIGQLDNDISVDLTSLSPVAREQEKQNWLTFLGLVTNPQLGVVLSMSPALMRKTAGYFDIHSERDLQEVSKAMQMAAMMAMQAQMGAAGPQTPGPGPTPSNSEIGGQLAEQLPVELSQAVQ